MKEKINEKFKSKDKGKSPGKEKSQKGHITDKDKGLT
jgi:hypothetical protein